MGVQTTDPIANLVASTQRGPSYSVWGNCPILDFIEDPSKGTYFFDDFVVTGNAVMSSAYTASFGQWSAYGAAGALLADGQLEGGVAKLGSDGANEGVTLNSGTGSFRMVTTSTLALNQKLWFECRFARSSIATTDGDYFMGLAIPALSSGLPRANYPILTTDDTLDATNGTFIGFHSNMTTGTRGGPTEVAVAFNLAGGTVNYPTNLTTLMASTGQTVLAANTYVKLGMVFDPSAPVRQVTLPTARQTAGQLGRALVQFYVNGVLHPAFLTAADVQNATAAQAFPTGFMAPTMAVMNGAGTASTMNLDWVRVAQIANS